MAPRHASEWGFNGRFGCRTLKILNVISISLIICLAFSLDVFASPAFNDLSFGDLVSAVKDFSAMTDMTSVSPATGLQKWGFEVGMVGGIAQTNDLESLATRAGGGSDISLLPRAAILGRMTFPKALTLEAEWLPPLTFSGTQVSQFGLALQWTFTDGLCVTCFADLAVKLKYSFSRTSFQQVIDNASTSFTAINAGLEMKDSVWGLDLIASHEFGLIEPYLAFGYLFTTADFSISGANNATVFTPSFSAAQSAHFSTESFQGSLGFNFYPFPLLAFGAEYSRAFDVNNFTGKLSLQFD